MPLQLILIMIIIITVVVVTVIITTAVETLGALNLLSRLLLSDLGRRIINISGKARELNFMYQLISVLV